MPSFPFPGLPVDLRAKSTGPALEREWFDLPSHSSSSSSGASSGGGGGGVVDDGNMVVSVCGSDVHHSLLLSSLSHAQPMRWLSLRAPFAFPRAKSGRLSYEGYVAEGVVRGHWVLKHKYVIPSVALVAIDWLDAAPYESQEVAACMRIAKVRGELQGRDTRVALLVVRSTRFASAEEEAAFVERLSRGIRKAGVDPPAPLRSVLLLISSDAKASVKRLEPLIFDLSLDYYRSAVRRLKAMKGRISRSAQPLLYVRHQLKAAYFSEAIKDVAGAVKHYSHAHSALCQYVAAVNPAVLSTPLAHELRAVGLVVNHRLCRLLLAGSKWSEAIDQFHLHLATFKRCVGLPDLLFAHYDHLSQQFDLFGDLLEQSSYHHPTSHPRQRSQVHSGFFYHTAATYAGKRKINAHLVLSRQRNGSLQGPALLPPAQLAPAAHLGQARLPYSAVMDDPRGVAGFSTFVQSTDPSDLVRSVLSVESGVEHSSVTIHLLNKSCNRYQKEHSERMLVSVASQTASEYFTAKQWRKAQTLFDRIATTYREEQWWMILTNTLMASYHCAKELGQQREVVHYALELLGRYATTTTEQKERIHLHLLTLLSAPPTQGELDGEPSHTVDVPVKYRLIECDAAFLTTPASVVYAYTSLHLVLVLDYHFPLPVTCTTIQLTFNHPQYHLTLQHDDSAPPSASTSSSSPSTSDDEDANGEVSAAPLHLQASSSGVVVCRLHFRPNRSLTLHVELAAASAPSTPLSLVHLISHVLLGPGSRVLRLRSWPNRREDEEVLQPVYTKAGAANGAGGEEEGAGGEQRKAKKKAKKKGGRDVRTAAEREEERRREEEEREMRASALSTKLGSVSIVPPPPAVRVQVSHPSPPLLHEFFPLRIHIDSRTDDLTQATLTVTAVDAERAGGGGDGVGEASTTPPSADGQAEAAAAPGSKGDNHHQDGGEAPSASNSAAGAGSADVDGDAPRVFIRAASAASSFSSSSSAPPPVLAASEFVELTSALPLPRVAPHCAYDAMVYLRLSSLHLHRISLALAYVNGNTAFHQSTTHRLTLTAKPALHIKLKAFTDGSAAITATHPTPHTSHHSPHTHTHTHTHHHSPQSTSSQPSAAAHSPGAGLTPVHLQVHHRTALHCEVDNASPHPLALTDIRLALPKAAFDVEEAAAAADGANSRTAPAGGGADAGLSEALLSSPTLYATRHTDLALLPPSSSSSTSSSPSSPLSSPCVFLAPGERYIHLFYFTPRTAGRVLSSHISLHFTRLHLPPAVLHPLASSSSSSPLLPALTASLDGGRGAAGHALSEKQREDLLKRLAEEQKQRAKGGDATPTPTTSSTNHHSSASSTAARGVDAAAGLSLSPSPLPSPSSTSSSPPSSESVSGESVVVAALQELQVAEAEEAEEERRRGGAQGGAEDAEALTTSKGGGVDAAPLSPMRPASSASFTAGGGCDAGGSVGSPLSASSSASQSFPCIPVRFSQALPSLVVTAPPLQLRLHYPAVVPFGQPFTFSLTISNASEHTHTAAYHIGTPHLAAAAAAVDAAVTSAPPTAAATADGGGAAAGAAAAPPATSLPHSLTAAAAASAPLSSAPPPLSPLPAPAPPHPAAAAVAAASAASAGALAPAAAARLLLMGCTSGVVRLFPSSSHRLQWRCLPLDCGFVPLPLFTAQLLTGTSEANLHASIEEVGRGAAVAPAPSAAALALLDEDERMEVFVAPTAAAAAARRGGGGGGGEAAHATVG